MDLSIMNNVFEMKKPKAERVHVLDIQKEMRRLVERAQFYNEPITTESVAELLIDFENASYENFDASEIIEQIEDLVAGFSRHRGR